MDLLKMYDTVSTSLPFHHERRINESSYLLSVQTGSCSRMERSSSREVPNMTSQKRSSAKCGGTCEDREKFLEGFTGSNSPCDACSCNYLDDDDGLCEFALDDHEDLGLAPNCITEGNCRYQTITDCRPTYYSVRCGKS